MNTGNHIINKVFLDINAESEKEATLIKDNISVFFYNELFPELEKLFDKYDEGQIIRFDRLDVGFNVLDWNNLKTVKAELIKRVEKQIEGTVEKPVGISETSVKGIDASLEQNQASKQFIDHRQNRQSTLLFFLRNGYLPWYGKQENITEITQHAAWQENLEDAQFLASLKELLRENKHAIQRLVFQFDNKLVLTLVKSFKLVEIKNINKLRNFVDTLAIQERNLFLQHLIHDSIKADNPETSFLKFVKLYLLRCAKSNEIETSASKSIELLIQDLKLSFDINAISRFFQLSDDDINTITKEIEELVSGPHGGEPVVFDRTIPESESTIISHGLLNSEREKEPPLFDNYMHVSMVQNAGLVLFHPFLSSFFKSFNWLTEKGKIRKAYHFHAVQALHFLATGNDEYFEGNMLLEKFICGFPIMEPIPAQSLLNTNVKDEVNNLLQQIIKNWPALKNTSPDGLRQMFVQRDGKLTRKDKVYKLIVERKVQDVLLEKLQWNISLVKLPWKDDLLFVEW